MVHQVQGAAQPPSNSAITEAQALGPAENNRTNGRAPSYRIRLKRKAERLKRLRSKGKHLRNQQQRIIDRWERQQRQATSPAIASQRAAGGAA